MFRGKKRRGKLTSTVVTMLNPPCVQYLVEGWGGLNVQDVMAFEFKCFVDFILETEEGVLAQAGTFLVLYHGSDEFANRGFLAEKISSIPTFFRL